MDQYEQEHIKPPVTKLLLSSELYCRVCGLILTGDQAAALQGHQAVIQALSRKGIYVMESDDTPVTEPDLSRAPIKMVRRTVHVGGSTWGAGLCFRRGRGRILTWMVRQCPGVRCPGSRGAGYGACALSARLILVGLQVRATGWQCVGEGWSPQ